MTDEQILKLVREHFIEEEVDDDGYCWIEYAGRPDAFLKFARAMYAEGDQEGYAEGYQKGYGEGNQEGYAEGCSYIS
jgi:hypothetical protein